MLSCAAPVLLLLLPPLHAQTLEENQWPSATAVRKAFFAGDAASAEDACGYPLPLSPICRPDALDLLLLHKLRTSYTSCAKPRALGFKQIF